MKRYVLMLILVPLFAIAPTKRSDAQIEVITEAIKKVIKAIDLQVQRLQNYTIDLQNAQQSIQNTLSKLKLDDISQWAAKQKELFQTYYDDLWKVKSVITLYKRGKDIVEEQVALVNEYKQAYALFRQDSHFSPDEIAYMADVYNGILTESIENLDQIKAVLNAFTVQMDDAKRLQILEAAADKIDQNLVDLRRFNNSNVIISLQRSKDYAELQQMKAMYGVQ